MKEKWVLFTREFIKDNKTLEKGGLVTDYFPDINKYRVRVNITPRSNFSRKTGVGKGYNVYVHPKYIY